MRVEGWRIVKRAEMQRRKKREEEKKCVAQEKAQGEEE